MKQIYGAGVILLFCVTTVFAAHQKLPSKKEAEMMLQQVSDAANLWEPGTPPYHLSAAVHLELGGSKFDGRYDLWWAAPDKYREGFMMPVQGGMIAETDLALIDKFYVLRNTPTLSIPLFEARTVLHGGAWWTGEGQTRKVWSIFRDTGNDSCIDSYTGSEALLTEACFDAAGEVVSVGAKPNAQGPAAIDALEIWMWRLGQFTDFANSKRFPYEIEARQYYLAIAISVKSLDTISRFDDDTFEPPAHAMALPWCSDPTIGRDSEHAKHFSEKPYVEVQPPGSYAAYYIYVEPDGRVSEAAPVRSGGDANDKRMENWLRKYPYATRSCGGQPVPWESIELLPEYSLY